MQAIEKRFQSTKIRGCVVAPTLFSTCKNWVFKIMGTSNLGALLVSSLLGSPNSGTEEWGSQIQTLKEELQCLKTVHQDKEKSLQDKIQFLEQQLKQKAQTTPSSHHRQAEAAYRERIQHLSQEVTTKIQTIQELTHTVQRLQKERKSMLCVSSLQQECKTKETHVPLSSGEDCRSTFPALQSEQPYQHSLCSGIDVDFCQGR
ncbi:centrosomal protein of 162 kDa-like [Thalassophryne amazonica]|uniref:centrosomal protein of 162 kDa-like n=1 Tax=Thalassophryne amazonica TaxID=390379 RepID=UPI001471FC78|nr:centrosomal protein of 162 kDa-like [Thalassophryne amazonica]